MTEEHRYDPKYRHARVRKDEQGVWQITTCYDYLPLDAFITYEYRGDDFLPVVWDTLPASREEQDDVVLQACEAFLRAKVATPCYFAGDNGEVYLLTDEGFEHVICVTTAWGNAYEIAHAMNHTFPHGDTRAFHEEERRRAEARLLGLQQVLTQSPPDPKVGESPQDAEKEGSEL